MADARGGLLEGEVVETIGATITMQMRDMVINHVLPRYVRTAPIMLYLPLLGLLW
jgi:hypothetical protein